MYVCICACVIIWRKDCHTPAKALPSPVMMIAPMLGSASKLSKALLTSFIRPSHRAFRAGTCIVCVCIYIGEEGRKGNEDSHDRLCYGKALIKDIHTWTRYFDKQVRRHAHLWGD